MFCTQSQLKTLKHQYPKGIEVRLTSAMLDDLTPIARGSIGVVNLVDDSGAVHVNWTSGRTLATEFGIDRLRATSLDKLLSWTQLAICVVKASQIKHLIKGSHLCQTMIFISQFEIAIRQSSSIKNFLSTHFDDIYEEWDIESYEQVMDELQRKGSHYATQAALEAIYSWLLTTHSTRY
ncbi:DUF4314 domain-containing protein [Vibrio mediterranei]